MNLRIGTGFDVHAFTDGDHLMLGGVRIPADMGVAAHSDGDVLLHALMDALLGAVALGDLGEHFPSESPAWRDADSRRMLRQVMAGLDARGWRVANADTTVITQRPRLRDHVAAMRKAIAADLGVDIDHVSVKATTTDGLGFTGRREGIACQAVVLVERRT